MASVGNRAFDAGARGRGVILVMNTPPGFITP